MKQTLLHALDDRTEKDHPELFKFPYPVKDQRTAWRKEEENERLDLSLDRRRLLLFPSPNLRAARPFSKQAAEEGRKDGH